MYIMGINSFYHDSSACLLRDGELVAAAEEERFNRRKHGKRALSDNPDELPTQAMQYCLSVAGVQPCDVQHIGYSTNPNRIALGMTDSEAGLANNWANPTDKALLLSSVAKVPTKLKALGFDSELTWIDHHTAHAASAFYAAPFREAAVLAVDGIGDEVSTAASFHGEESNLVSLRDIPLPASLGFLWELVSVFLGFDVYDASKLMGLAAYGDSRKYAGEFSQLVSLNDDGGFSLDNHLLRFGLMQYYPPSGYCEGLESLFGCKSRKRNSAITTEHRDVAAALQAITNKTVLHMIDHLHAVTGSDNLCLAGGVALNCVTNRFVFEEGPFGNLYVQPAANDAGTALGAAYYVWHQHLGKKRCDAMPHAFLGPEFSDASMLRALSRSGLKYRRSTNVVKEVASLISDGRIVGFFQGRMEFGPRALGNRSLLADPRNPEMREILNRKVKHREYFRPLAPSVLAEEANDWFHIVKQTTAAEFMLMAYPVKEHVRKRIPAVMHVDGTSRVQVVTEVANPRFHQLISAFREATGVPMVLNTSFNDSEPIVCSPDDAIATFQKTAIDCLALGDFLVARDQQAETVN